MRQRPMIATAIIIVAGLALLGFDVDDANAAELKLGHYVSPKHTLHADVFVPWADKLKKESGGNITIKIFDSGKLGKGPTAQYRRVKDGAFELGFGPIVYTPDLFPRSMIASKPGVGQTAVEITAKIWDNYEKYFQDEYQEGKLLALFANWPSVLMSRKPIRTPEDIRGLIIRVSSSFDIPQVERWGAKAEQIPVTESYDALQKGTVDAIYIAPSALYQPWNFHEPASYVTVGLKSPASVFFFMANLESWNNLTENQRRLIENHSGRRLSLDASRIWGKADEEALEKIKTQTGLEVITLTPAEAAAFDELTEQTVAAELNEDEKKGIPAWPIYKELTK